MWLCKVTCSGSISGWLQRPAESQRILAANPNLRAITFHISRGIQGFHAGVGQKRHVIVCIDHASGRGKFSRDLTRDPITLSFGSAGNIPLELGINAIAVNRFKSGFTPGDLQRFDRLVCRPVTVGHNSDRPVDNVSPSIPPTEDCGITTTSMTPAMDRAAPSSSSTTLPPGTGSELRWRKPCRERAHPEQILLIRLPSPGCLCAEQTCPRFCSPPDS